MPIETNNPVAIIHPEIPYDKLAPSLAISPLFEEKYIGAAVAVTLTPYRVLPDGTINVNRDAARTMAIADAFAQAQSDPVLAAAVQAIYGALETFIAAKGL